MEFISIITFQKVLNIAIQTFSITSYNFHFFHLDNFSHIPEFYTIQYKGPHIITKPVCVQTTLK